MKIEMKKKIESDSRKRFLILRKDFIDRYLDRVFTTASLLRDDPIGKFRKEWHIPKSGLKDLKAIDPWWKSIQKPLASKRREITYIETEEFITVDGFEPKERYYSLLMEKEPRVINDGESLEVVFEYEIKKLMRKTNLDPNFHIPFKFYILTDKIFPETVHNLGIELSERLTIGPDWQEVDHRISLNLAPNMEESFLQDFFKFTAKAFLERAKGKLKRKPQDIQDDNKVIEILKSAKTMNQKTGKLDYYQIADDVFSPISEGTKDKRLSFEEENEADKKRARMVKNIIHYQLGLLRS